jgi:hypothetical protein
MTVKQGLLWIVMALAIVAVFFQPTIGQAEEPDATGSTSASATCRAALCMHRARKPSREGPATRTGGQAEV